MAKQKFSLQTELEKAQTWLIANMKQQKASGDAFRGRGDYFTATDLEQRVRAAVHEINEGLEYGSVGNSAYLFGVRINGLGGISLLSHCRSFLRKQIENGTLRSDHPSDSHTCSGLRFRPADWDLNEAEKKTKSIPEEERKRIDWIKHYEPGVEKHSYGSKRHPYCQRNVKKKKGYAGWRSRKQIHSTHDLRAINCKKCIQMVAKLFGMGKDTLPQILGDYLEDHPEHLKTLLPGVKHDDLSRQGEGPDGSEEQNGEDRSSALSCGVSERLDGVGQGAEGSSEAI